jgi:glutamate-5-semialdehyde dehydrogenase
MNELTHIPPGMTVLYGGNQLARVPDEITERFRPGDRLLVVQQTGEILHVPNARWEIAGSGGKKSKKYRV